MMNLKNRNLPMPSKSSTLTDKINPDNPDFANLSPAEESDLLQARLIRAGERSGTNCTDFIYSDDRETIEDYPDDKLGLQRIVEDLQFGIDMRM